MSVSDLPRPLPALGQASHDAEELSQAAELDRLHTEIRDLRGALETRPVIDQARGMIMTFQSCGPDIAWQILVETSQHNNIRLHQVAAALVATTEGRTLPEPMRCILAEAMHRQHQDPHP